ncbi:MAG TPA: N-acetyltransferase [Lachnoclostridium sp.]|uniref:RimJ/RimL family protein N-acetyltransferase n=1 Tax=[Clostridium] celerecrescens 18A TaxID=1286362 RepID=A0A2M8Z1D1_9FIRM|nr:GNAT family protein [Lacrimispora celerecrescens]PJJ27268.1 RimJ/RimL family protein N-acetyltransferase [[Clostridium] celerecrescens 18A]HBE85182.1 N-acetyltransferase [Lachnoclostridium sp.]
MNVIIRPIEENDAESLWQMMSALDAETKYMMYEPKERMKNIDRIKSTIKEAVTGNNLFLVAEADHVIVGYISAQKGILRRVKHSAYIVVGIRAAYQRQGIGTSFFKQLDKWADEKGVTRFELTVMCINDAARRLYEKNGFVVEGIKKNSMVVDGTYVDEYYMAKLL